MSLTVWQAGEVDNISVRIFSTYREQCCGTLSSVHDVTIAILKSEHL